MYNSWGREWQPPNSDDDDSTGFISDNDINFAAFSQSHNLAGHNEQSLDRTLDRTQDGPTDQQLRIVVQPETQHRARYLSEGSRGAIKDRGGKSYCTIQLIGVNRPTKVEILAANEADPNTPHPYYRLIAVTGKGGSPVTTPCKEIVSSDGLSCIEVTLHPTNRMTAVLDCVGVLKICSHDVKRRVPKAIRGSSIRLVFRAKVADAQDSTKLRLLTAVSDPISCVQHLGFPEIHRSSVTASPATGGVDCFLIGKNFQKNSAVVFREHNEEGRLVWISEATVDRKYLSQCHIICSIPTYRDLNLTTEVQVDVTVECANKRSAPFTFTYKPTERRSAIEDAPLSAFHPIKSSPTPLTSPQWDQAPPAQTVTTTGAYIIYPPSQQQSVHINSMPSTPTAGLDAPGFLTSPLSVAPSVDLASISACTFQPLAGQQQQQQQSPLLPRLSQQQLIDSANCYGLLDGKSGEETSSKRPRTDFGFPGDEISSESQW